MTYRRMPPLMLVLVALAFHPVLYAQTATAPGGSQLYRVAPPSDYEKGCFGPCACPVLEQDGLIGTFHLTPTMPDPLYAHYAVTDINWLLPRTGVRITGSGTYKVRELAPFTQQLVLDLAIDGQGTQHFDSGLVQTGTALPAIDATVSLNGMICQDTRLRVVAEPALPKDEVPYALLGSFYEEGCFGPCACAVTAKPLLGRFGLVKLQDTSDGTDFAVVDASWLVQQTPATTATNGYPVTGMGIYRIGALGKTQRMILDLLENGAGPARFDSGTVPLSGSLKRINIDVAANGFACSDRVYSIRARRRTAAMSDLFVLTPEPFHAGVTPVP